MQDVHQLLALMKMFSSGRFVGGDISPPSTPEVYKCDIKGLTQVEPHGLTTPNSDLHILHQHRDGDRLWVWISQMKVKLIPETPHKLSFMWSRLKESMIIPDQSPSQRLKPEEVQ